MKLTITINLDNPAFEPDAGHESARILDDLATRLRNQDDLGGLENLRENLRDVNGNVVGKAVVK